MRESQLRDFEPGTIVRLADGKLVGIIKHTSFLQDFTHVIDASGRIGVGLASAWAEKVRGPLLDIAFVPTWIQMYSEGLVNADKGAH